MLLAKALFSLSAQSRAVFSLSDEKAVHLMDNIVLFIS
jgi:hypothetical protein